MILGEEQESIRETSILATALNSDRLDPYNKECLEYFIDKFDALTKAIKEEGDKEAAAKLRHEQGIIMTTILTWLACLRRSQKV